MADETQPPTHEPRSEKEPKPPKLRVVKGTTKKSPPGRPFKKGNKFGGPRPPGPTNPVEDMDKIARETLTRLRRREYSNTLDESGKRKVIERQLDAPRANAIFVGLRLRLDLFAQFKAGEEVRRLQTEVERLLAIVPRIGDRPR